MSVCMYIRFNTKEGFCVTPISYSDFLKSISIFTNCYTTKLSIRKEDKNENSSSLCSLFE